MKGKLVRWEYRTKGLSIAPKTLANFLDRIAQLFEQGTDVRRIGQYFRNWLRWLRAGVEISESDIKPPDHAKWSRGCYWLIKDFVGN